MRWWGGGLLLLSVMVRPSRGVGLVDDSLERVGGLPTGGG